MSTDKGQSERYIDFLETFNEIGADYLVDVVISNITVSVEMLESDPSGIQFIDMLLNICKKSGNFINRLMREIELFANVYNSFWGFFTQFEHEIQLW